MLEEIMNEVTEDWLACFEKPENQNGFMWRMVARELLPMGVNPFDERVKRLIAMAQEQTGIKPGAQIEQ